MRYRDNPDEYWYWTSTEVKERETDKAWIVSHLPPEPIQETHENTKHIKSDHIFTLYG